MNGIHSKVNRHVVACECSIRRCTVDPWSLDGPRPNGRSAVSPDNSGTNKAHNTTADQQSEAASDRMLTKKIRQALIADKSLSTYGHNVKIITKNGSVTLKGPVHSEEKQTIATKTESIVGSPG